MALSKPPTMEELVDFDFVDFRETMCTRAHWSVDECKSLYAPYFEKCNVDDSDYFMFFMLKQIENGYYCSFPLYLIEHHQQPLLGGKLLALCFELRDVITKYQSWRLVWKTNSVTLYLNLFSYKLLDRSIYDIYEIPINNTNYTKQFPFKYVTVYATRSENFTFKNSFHE